MNHISKTLLVVGAAAALAVGTFVSVLNLEAFAQANNTGSNASSIGPKVESQKIIVMPRPINFTGSIPLHSTINNAISSIIKVP